ncbi:hypothetical protein FACS1894120_6580 [Clostridia bacterium]|nr:hypothetical protein FACS1894120_6580 [Clostridia bacterium]
MADSGLGLRIGIDGERDFKNALRDINQSFKVLGSEMRLVESDFNRQDKSIQSITARNGVLNKEIDAQKDKITTLEQALQNASDSFGESDRRTQNWAIQLNNARAELNGMEREVDSNEQALDDLANAEDDVGDSADDMGEELSEAGDDAEKSGGKFEKLGGILKGIGAAMGAVLTNQLTLVIYAAYKTYEFPKHLTT